MVDDNDDRNFIVCVWVFIEEEVVSGCFIIFDVVLFVFGYEVVYFINEFGVFYKDFMVFFENGGFDFYDMRRWYWEFSLLGCYRKFMGKFLFGGDEGIFLVEVWMYVDDME